MSDLCHNCMSTVELLSTHVCSPCTRRDCAQFRTKHDMSQAENRAMRELLVEWSDCVASFEDERMGYYEPQVSFALRAETLALLKNHKEAS